MKISKPVWTMKSHALFFVMLSFLCGSNGLVKTWLPTTFFETETNWIPQRSSPCDNDLLVFPEVAFASLSYSVSVKEIVLPLNGEIMITEGASFETTLSNNCQGREYSFVANKKHHWWKPANWDFETPYLVAGGQSNIAIPDVIPDADRVPCSFDDAVIPNGTLFRMIMTGTPAVRSLTINGQPMNSASFQSFMSSSEGRRLIEGDGKLRVGQSQDQDCSDPTGCLCTNAQEQANNMMICEAAGSCPDTLCTDPIMPDGFCCPFCCSLVDFEYQDGFKLTSLKHKISKLLEETPVTCYMSKRMEGKVQAICVDNLEVGTTHTKTTHSRTFVEQARKEILQDSSLHVGSARTLHSVKYPSDQPYTTGSDVGLIVGLLLLFLLGGALAVAFYFYRKKRLPNFDFVRFDRGVTKVEVELGTTPHEELQPLDDPVVTSSGRIVFSNPVYAKESSSHVERMPDRRENPLYGIKDVVEE